MRCWWKSICFLALVIFPASCAKDDAEAESDCNRLCTDLEVCGLLPSALSAGVGGAAGIDNCELRCKRSSEEVRETAVQCVPKETITETGAYWCDPSSRCPEIRNCLLGTFSEDIPVVGSSELSVGFGKGEVLESECSAACGGNPADSMVDANSGCSSARLSDAQRILPLSPCEVIDDVETCGDCEDGACSFSECTCDPEEKADWCCDIASCSWDGSEEWCGILGMNSVQLFAIQDGVERVATERPCAEGLSWQELFPELLPGRIRVGARFRGSCSEGMCGCGFEDNAELSCATDTADALADPVEPSCDGGIDEDAGVSSWCLVVYAQEVVASAGNTMTSNVLLPDVGQMAALLETVFGDVSSSSQDVYYCEETAELCSDTRDNDGDGAIDCADPGCAVYCGGEGI